jgi:hypothetical protein
VVFLAFLAFVALAGVDFVLAAFLDAGRVDFLPAALVAPALVAAFADGRASA